MELASGCTVTLSLYFQKLRRASKYKKNKGFGCLLAWVLYIKSFFYHKWSKLDRIVYLDPKETKNSINLRKKMLRALFWSVLKIRKKCLFDIFHFTSKFTKSENKRMSKLFGSCLSKAVRYIF